MSSLFLHFNKILSIIIAGQAYSYCDLPWPSEWIEKNDQAHQLVLKITNDRNLYFSYYLLESDTEIEISHKIYACSTKNLYFVTEDDTVELAAYINMKDPQTLILHLAKEGGMGGKLEFQSRK